MLPFRRLARWSPAHRTAVAAVAAGPPRQSALLHSSATTPQQDAPSREELKRSPNLCRELLGLPSTFDTKELQQAFHAAALQYHPDTPSKTANAEMFHASKVAHQTLQRVMARQADKDAEARRQALEQNIEHTAPQHREYLTHDGIGYGKCLLATPCTSAAHTGCSIPTEHGTRITGGFHLSQEVQLLTVGIR